MMMQQAQDSIRIPYSMLPFYLCVLSTCNCKFLQNCDIQVSDADLIQKVRLTEYRSDSL